MITNLKKKTIRYFKAGNVWFENRSRSHREYCLAPILDDDNQSNHLELHPCDTENNDETEIEMNVFPYCKLYFPALYMILDNVFVLFCFCSFWMRIVMLASVPFLIITFLVYLCVDELRNLHGKCLLGYLICMASGYTCLAWVKINGVEYVEPFLCQSIGYLIYFSFISAFLWSNVLSCDLWWNFQ